MRIAYLSTFYPFRGGIAQSNANLYKALVEAGHDVTAYTFTVQYPSFLFPGKTQYVTPEDQAVEIPARRVLHTANPFSYRKTAKMIAAQKPDLLVLRYWMTYMSPSLGYVARYLKKRGCKVVSLVDNVIPHETRFFDKPLTRWFLKQNSGCVTMSRSVEHDLLDLSPGKAHAFFPHPIYDHFGTKTTREQALEQLRIPAGSKYVLFFGIIRAYKGLDLLIEAMDLVKTDCHLIIAGESYGPFDAYTRQIEQLKQPDRVHVFAQYIDDAQVPLFFSAADVCVLPYRSATQSGITAMSLHFDVPLIATPVGGLAEMIETPGTGLMASDIQAPALAQAIDHFFELGPDRFVQSIDQLKKTLTWAGLAKTITSL